MYSSHGEIESVKIHLQLVTLREDWTAHKRTSRSPTVVAMSARGVKCDSYNNYAYAQA